MKTKPKIALILLLLILAGTARVYARDEFSRIIKKEFKVNPDAQLIISNQFGKVHCNVWDKPLVSLEIVMKVEASNEKNAQKLLDKILIGISNSESLVEVKTTIEKDGFSGKSKLDIDIKVNMPASVNLDLTNKFGDIYIQELTGKSKINLSYGNLEVIKLGNSDNLIDIKFGNAEIKTIKGAVVMLKYSELDLDYAGSLRLDAKYSDLSAEKIISLNSNSEGGHLEIRNSGNLESKSKFSDLDIGRIEKNLTLDIQYGNCDVREMPSDFNSINIKNKYGDVSIGLPAGSSYSLEADLKFCDLDFPEDNATFTQKIIQNTSKSYKATVGKGTNPQGKIYVKSEFGNISLE